MDDDTLHNVVLALLVGLIFAFVFAPQTVPMSFKQNNTNQKLQLTLPQLPDTIFKYMFGSTKPITENDTFGTSYNNFASYM